MSCRGLVFRSRELSVHKTYRSPLKYILSLEVKKSKHNATDLISLTEFSALLHSFMSVNYMK